MEVATVLGGFYMESKWKNQLWYKRLFIGMHVAKISQETQFEVQKQLDALDEELAGIRADTLYHCLKSSKVEERFLYCVRSDISYRGFLLSLMSKRGYSIEARYIPIQHMPAAKSDNEKELIAKEIVDIIRSSSSENEFVERMHNYTPTDFHIEEKEDVVDTDDIIPDVISACEKLASELEQVVITLRSGVELEGRIITTLQPDKAKEFEGAVYVYTNTGKTVRVIPTEISVIKSNEKFDSRFDTFYKMAELYNAIMNTECIGKKISAVHNMADSSFLVHTDFLYDSEAEERSCHVAMEGPLVIEFEDGTNVAFSTFMGPTFGVTKNFTGEYEGDGKPNIDVNIFFKRIIGKCITIVELESFPLSIGKKDSEYDVCVYPKDDVPDELVAEIHLCLDDGTIFEIKEYGEYGLLEPDKSMACITVKDLWEACGIPEEYA